MTILDTPLILHKDVEFRSVNNFSEKLLEKLGGSNEDFIISVRNSRAHSKRISHESKSFLSKFKDPDLFVNVVARHSVESASDAGALLTDTYPLIKSFLTNGFLEYFENKETPVNEKMYAENDRAYGYRIITCIQNLDDTEVYKAIDDKGSFVLLKCIYTHTQTLRANATKEIDILKMLNSLSNTHVPRLFNSFNEEKHIVLVMEWLEGKSLWDIINDTQLAFKNRIKVVKGIIDGYHHLHECGVLHSDIHPNNIKVTETFDVKIFDFGSSVKNSRKSTEPHNRAGIISYFESEMADSILKYNRKIAATDAGEQYQLSVLIYQVITGNHYLSLSYETDTALRQITTQLPRPFADFTITWKPVEKVLNKALSKKPEDRYRNWEEFYITLRKSLTYYPKTLASKPLIAPDKLINEAYLDECIAAFVQQYGFDSAKTDNLAINKPYCSFFHGASGIAYVFYRLSYIYQNPEFLALSDVWISKAKAIQHQDGAFNNDAIGLPLTNIGSHSVFHHVQGLLIAEALVRHAQGDLPTFNALVEQFITLVENTPLEENDRYFLDPTQGPASILPGISILISVGKPHENFPIATLNELSEKIVSKLFPVVYESLQMGAMNGKNNFLGFAHGYAGLLYMIMQADFSLIAPYQKQIEELLSILEKNGIVDQESIYWPVEFSDSDSAVWSGWCHGTAGHILLWLSAYKVFSNKNYLSLALKAGEYLWKTTKGVNPSICCGLAGQSLAFFKLAQASEDTRWVDRGLVFAKAAIHAKKEYLLPDSLFQGETGIALMAAETINPMRAIFPICDRIYEAGDKEMF